MSVRSDAGHHDWCEIGRQRDYLSTPCPSVDLIVCNPPFSLSLEFFQKSLTEASAVAYLPRLNFLAS
jgi:tRNA1(Val) A37 N6-methylase TrmN6